MYSNDRETGFGTGVMIGALVGAGVALLFAPKAGVDLRNDLSGSMTSVRDAVTRHYRALAERAGIELENLEERVDQAAQAIEATARDAMDAAGEARRRHSLRS